MAPVRIEPARRRAPEEPLFSTIDRFGADAESVGAPGLHLAEHDLVAAPEHEIELTDYALRTLGERFGERLTIHGPSAATERGGVLSFEFEGIHPHDLTQVFDEHGVCVRAGHHCAKPLMRYLEVAATARASFYVYTVEEDIDQMVKALWNARKVFGLD